MSYRVRLAASAAIDLKHRLTSLAERSPRAALALNERFEQGLLRLKDRPLSCGLAYENRSFDEEIRHLLFG